MTKGNTVLTQPDMRAKLPSFEVEVDERPVHHNVANQNDENVHRVGIASQIPETPEKGAEGVAHPGCTAHLVDAFLTSTDDEFDVA